MATASDTELHAALCELIRAGRVGEVQRMLRALKRPISLLQALRDDHGWTLLHLACRYGDMGTVYFLLNQGADASAIATKGEHSTLHLLASRGAHPLAPSIMAELIKSGAPIRHLNGAGETCLHTACTRNNMEVARFMLERAKIDVTLPNAKGLTALQVAIFQQSLDLVQLLVKHGAPVTTEELETARKHASAAILEVLKRASVRAVGDVVAWSVDNRAALVAPPRRAWDVYRLDMMHKRHHVFLSDAVKVAVVQANATAEGEFPVLLIDGTEFLQFSLSANHLALYATAGIEDEIEQIRRALWTQTPWFPLCEWRRASHACVTQGAHLLWLEARLCPRPSVQIGVIYGCAGQTTEADMMLNDASPWFTQMVQGLRGDDVLRDDDVVHFRGFQLQFFVATALDDAERRQHIGNSTALLFLCEEGAAPDPTFRGSVNALALVLTRSGPSHVILSGHHRLWLDAGGYTPLLLPKEPVTDTDFAQLRRFVFANCTDAQWCASAATQGPYAVGRARLFDSTIKEFIRLESPNFEASKRSFLDSGTAAMTLSLSSDNLAALATEGAPVNEDAWLLKFEPASGSWERRWCVLRVSGLTVYKKRDDPDSMVVHIPVLLMTEVVCRKSALDPARGAVLFIYVGVADVAHEFAPVDEGSEDATSFRFSIVLAKQQRAPLRHAGWMFKRKELGRMVVASPWKRRFVVLEKNQLRWSERPSQLDHASSIALTARADMSVLREDGQEMLVVVDEQMQQHRFYCPQDAGDSVHAWLEGMMRFKAALAASAEAKGPRPLTSVLPTTAVATPSAPAAALSSPWPPLEPGQVPPFLSSAMSVLMERALTTKGIARESGEQDAMMALVEAWKHGRKSGIAELMNADVHDIMGAVKRFYRDMNPPLLEFSNYAEFVEIAALDDGPVKFQRCVRLITALPHYALFQKLFSLLAAMYEERNINLMDAKNLAIVFAPSILRDPDETPMSMLVRMETIAQLVAFIIANTRCCGLLTDAPKWAHDGSSPRGKNPLSQSRTKIASLAMGGQRTAPSLEKRGSDVGANSRSSARAEAVPEEEALVSPRIGTRKPMTPAPKPPPSTPDAVRRSMGEKPTAVAIARQLAAKQSAKPSALPLTRSGDSLSPRKSEAMSPPMSPRERPSRKSDIASPPMSPRSAGERPPDVEAPPPPSSRASRK